MLDENSSDNDFAFGEDEEEKIEKPKETINSLSIEELESQLNSALENEDYELASKLRDEMNKRNSN